MQEEEEDAAATYDSKQHDRNGVKCLLLNVRKYFNWAGDMNFRLKMFNIFSLEIDYIIIIITW